jgi:AcrR family transcriptional regulator
LSSSPLRAAADPAAPAPGRRERNKQEKRERIVAAARALFAEKGFEATTTAEIANRADIGVGTLFLYYASKEDLLVRVFREDMDHVVDDAFASLPPGAPLLDELIHAYGALIELHERDRSLARAFVKELMFVGDANRESVAAFLDGLMQRTAARIEHAQRTGAFDPAAPAHALAENLFRLYIAMLQRWLGFHSTVASADHIARLRRAFELQLHGFENR